MGDGDFWELYGGVLARSTATKSFVFHRLASDLREIEALEWEVMPDPKIPILRDFTMDPSQDLLVLIEFPDVYCLPSLLINGV